MKRINLFVFVVLIISIVGCKSSYYPSQTEGVYYNMDEELGEELGVDTTLAQMISPYSLKLEKEMGGTIGFCYQDLKKGVFENSDLGNWMADVMVSEGSKLSKGSIDFSVINHGSMRIPVLKEGRITKGTIYELMPFDNIVWVLDLDGSTVEKLFNHMANKKGWGISKGSHYKIVDNLATDIYVNDEVFDVNKSYRVCLADYIAKGGDDSSFLKGLPKEELNVLLREALLNFVREKDIAGEKIGVEIEKRVF